MTEHRTAESTARTYARTAGEAYRDAADYLRALPEVEWSGPTGCALWDVRTLAGHIVGEAVWFPNLTRGVTRREPPLPNDLYESLKTLPPTELADRLHRAADSIAPEIEAASPTQLREEVDLGWTRLPLWRATYVALMEAVYHDWDLHVGRDPEATIPVPRAQVVATGMSVFAPMLASTDGIAAWSGTYLLEVGDGVGPITMIARNGQLTVEQGANGTADAALSLTADQYVRLIAGRLPLVKALEQGALTATGDRNRLQGLTRIFRGIANDS